MSDRITIADKDLDGLLAEVDRQDFSIAKLPDFGTRLAKLVLPKSILQTLKTVQEYHLVVLNDARSSRIPWETTCVDGSFPAGEAGLTRRYLAENMSVAKWLEQRRMDTQLDILLVQNPTGDLPGADQEGERLETIAKKLGHVRLTKVAGAAATRPRLLREFSSGKYDLVHYAGHAFFDRGSRSRSGVICAGNEALTGADLASLSRLPALIVFNACESARVRKLGAGKSKTTRELIDRNVSLAEAYLRGGIANYVGTYWPVGDDSAKTFAEVFYGNVLSGESVGTALTAARKTVRDTVKSHDWADYIHYGDATFRLKDKEKD